ncbi:MAG: hypothetical protein MUC94_12925 [bacterium]|nr:hypothetical protein [bacterium]
MNQDKLDSIYSNLLFAIKQNDYKGFDPYDIMESKIIARSVKNRKLLLLLTQLNRISPVNFRRILAIEKTVSPKALALIILALLNKQQNPGIIPVQEPMNWLLRNKSAELNGYSIGFAFPITLSHYASAKNHPSLIISLFVMYAFLHHYKTYQDSEVLDQVLSFYNLIQTKLPRIETAQELSYSYNFEKHNEIYNSTAKLGKFFALLYRIDSDDALLVKIEKILNYLISKQRNDGTWQYGENIAYTDGFHTAFILEAIWYMKQLVDSPKISHMFQQGVDNYKNHLFTQHDQPLYFHPDYQPKDVRSRIIKTDIRDCAMAIVLFKKIGEQEMAGKVLDWTISNMYDHEQNYFYSFQNSIFKNKIEFMRWQAWMLYALSCYSVRAE